MKTIVTLGLMCFICGCANTHVEEARVDVHNGVPEVCGEGPGLNTCRDVDGETFEQELTVDTTPDMDSNEYLEKKAGKLKKEPFEKEVEELERKSE